MKINFVWIYVNKKNNFMIFICECFKEILDMKYNVKFVSVNKIYLWNLYWKKKCIFNEEVWYILGLFY